MKKLTKDMFWRHEQARERPQAQEAIKQMLNHSEHFLSGIRNLTSELQIFTEVEVSALAKLIDETKVCVMRGVLYTFNV